MSFEVTNSWSAKNAKSAPRATHVGARGEATHV
jgi:hypothetical protein